MPSYTSHIARYALEEIVAAGYMPSLIVTAPDAPQGKRFNDIATDNMKAAVSGLEIVSLGTPYKEGPNSWILVPYEVRWKGGGTQTNGLRLGKDSTGQWHWEGGF